MQNCIVYGEHNGGILSNTALVEIYKIIAVIKLDKEKKILRLKWNGEFCSE